MRKNMFKNKWNDKEAASFIKTHDSDRINADLAHRVYTSQLIGQEPDLVMHGGGNTSCKTVMKDLHGQNLDVLCVKGSGWDLGTIQTPGLPAVRLAPLLDLRKLNVLSDEDMVNVQLANLLDQSAPNPSVETLLHAFLPHKFIDHTHATPFLSLANLPDPDAILQEVFGQTLAVVPYVKPGFELAKLAAQVAEENPDAEGLLLLKHGHFTWGTDAKSSYDRVITHTNLIEEWFSQKREGIQYPSSQPAKPANSNYIDLITSAINQVNASSDTSFILDVVRDPSLVEQMDLHIINSVTDRGVATPDHVIRIKAKPLVITQDISAVGSDKIVKAIRVFVDDYTKYFDKWSAQADSPKTMLDPMPKLIWIESFGIIGVGATKKEARIITDLGAQNIRVITDGEKTGGFYPVRDNDLFDMEYWSLEQAKLGKASQKLLQGKVVMVTGAAGTIGSAIIKTFANAGAELVAVDNNAEALEQAANNFPAGTLLKIINLTKSDQIDTLLKEVILEFGGIDILISNAGTALQSSLLEMDNFMIRESFEINFFAHYNLSKSLANHFVKQGRKGQLLFNISKQAINPGKNFGAYGIPKAALMALMKQLALELGEHGIRVNGVNADRIRSGILNDEFISTRAQARNISNDEYMQGNLLGEEVEAHHVAKAFLDLSLSKRTTGHVMTVDGGNIEASLR
jgi:rhamnose utilization protein RhaD (predicted bifunctional aldolase and dehydrogenase)/NAD(P)-dependent dehydrogenase (short-subunit alcohol dehydrogenase family)